MLLVIPWLFLFGYFPSVYCISIPGCVPLDLTHTLDKNIPIYTGINGFRFTKKYKGPWGEFVEYMEGNEFTTAEHVGTHIDAPAHFSKGNKHIDEVPLDTLMGEACVIDIAYKARINPDIGVTVADIEEWEIDNGRIPRDGIILVNSGWSHKWSSPELYLGTKNVSDITSFHFPGFTGEAADWLVKNRMPRAVGVDTMSLDVGHNTPTFPAHVSLLSNSIPGCENLANIDKLPPRGATVFLSAMKIKGGSGGPIRAFALGWRGHEDPCRRAATSIQASFCLTIVFAMFVGFFCS